MDDNLNKRFEIVEEGFRKGEGVFRFEILREDSVFFEYLPLHFNGNLDFIIPFIELLFQRYSFDNSEKVLFYQKMIESVKKDKNRIFETDVQMKRTLLIYLAEKWVLERKTLKENSSIVVDEDAIVQKVCVEIEKKKHAKFTKPRITKVWKYSELFFPHPEKDYGTIVAKRLRGNGYLDAESKWVGTSTKKNELAVLLFVLKLPKHGICIIRDGETKQQMIAFYEEFGLHVTESSTSSSYSTLRNILTEPRYGDTHEIFKTMFSDLRNNFESKKR